MRMFCPTAYIRCAECRHQTSVTEGTLHHKSHVPLTKWFLAFYFVCQDKRGISAVQFSFRIGVTYKTAWRMLNLIRTAMGRRARKYKLEGTVEMDDTYFGGPTKGPRAKSTIQSDEYRSYIPALEGYTHEHRPYDSQAGMLRWLHILVSNAKAYILGTYQGLPGQHLQSYLDEFCYRFNRRGFGEGAFTRLAAAVVG